MSLLTGNERRRRTEEVETARHDVQILYVEPVLIVTEPGKINEITIKTSGADTTVKVSICLDPASTTDVLVSPDGKIFTLLEKGEERELELTVNEDGNARLYVLTVGEGTCELSIRGT